MTERRGPEIRLDDFATREAIAGVLGISVRPLSRLKGIPWVRVNEDVVLYDREAVAIWLTERGERQRNGS